MIDRGKTSHQRTSSAYSRNAIIYLMFAIVFGGWGLMGFSARPLFGWVMLLLGAVFMIAAVFNYSTSRKFMQPGSDKRT
jgi:1,4-dihydroxy-2-naphthoate octaprenyltransferase